MNRGLVILVVFLTVVPTCAFLGWWLAKKWLQARLDEFDQAILEADVLNARATAAGGDGAAKS
jgi:uncharacterized membrane protein